MTTFSYYPVVVAETVAAVVDVSEFLGGGALHDVDGDILISAKMR